MLKNYLKLFGLVLGIHNSFGLVITHPNYFDIAINDVTAASPTAVEIVRGFLRISYLFAATLPMPTGSSSNLSGTFVSNFYRVLIDKDLNASRDPNFNSSSLKDRTFYDITSPSGGDGYFPGGGSFIAEGGIPIERAYLLALDNNGKQIWEYEDLESQRPILKVKYFENNTLTGAGFTNDGEGIQLYRLNAPNGTLDRTFGGSGKVAIEVKNLQPKLGLALKVQACRIQYPLSQMQLPPEPYGYVAVVARSKGVDQINLYKFGPDGRIINNAFYKFPDKYRSILRIHIALPHRESTTEPIFITGNILDVNDSNFNFSVKIDPDTLLVDPNYGERGFGFIRIAGHGEEVISKGSAKYQNPALVNKSAANFLSIAQFGSDGSQDISIGGGMGWTDIGRDLNAAEIKSLPGEVLQLNNAYYVTSANTVTRPPTVLGSEINQQTEVINQPVALITRIIPDSEISPIVAATLKKYCGGM